MALLWQDGFDCYGVAGGDVATVLNSSQYSTSGYQVSSDTRTGFGYSLYQQNVWRQQRVNPLAKAFKTSGEIVRFRLQVLKRPDAQSAGFAVLRQPLRHEDHAAPVLQHG
jgi:hypothetical protein